jgi:hypothetical protein
MPERNSHWTENEDLLTRFVLDRVEAAERPALEVHLSTCEKCRRAVRAEQLLAAGIKRAGREELKMRLKERVAPRRTFKVAWYQVAGVAAAIVVLVSIGIYNHWFIVGEKEQAPSVVQKEQEAGKLEALADRSKLGEKDKAKSAPSAADAASARQREKEKSIVTVAPLQLAAAQAGKASEEPGKGGRGQTATWVEGTVLPRGAEERAAPQLFAPPTGKKTEQLRANKMEARAPTAQQQQDRAGAKEPAGLILTQRRLSDLPVSRQAEGQKLNTVQTLFQRAKGGMRLTLYLDTLATDPELQNASVVPIGEDSIILHLGNQRIGYKMPPGWNQETAKQTGRKK